MSILVFGFQGSGVQSPKALQLRIKSEELRIVVDLPMANLLPGSLSYVSSVIILNYYCRHMPDKRNQKCCI